MRKAIEATRNLQQHLGSSADVFLLADTAMPSTCDTTKTLKKVMLESSSHWKLRFTLKRLHRTVLMHQNANIIYEMHYVLLEKNELKRRVGKYSLMQLM